ncbi:MAG TPA: hypothetical protein VKA21_14465 [Candidatus Binatia bacterium]|nr:hypothetical protein [Candidatus Binatia bacterium]
MRALVVALCAAALAAPAQATYHIAHISEVWVPAPGAEYVEIEMLAPGETEVGGSRLSIFSCDGTSVAPLITSVANDVPNGGTGVRWSMGTQAFADATGVTPDFIYPVPGILAGCGMVCWGKPGTPSNPAQYVDCLAYGNYTGTVPATVGMPNPNAPDNATQSLGRVGTSTPANDAVDFALGTPSPTNNTLSATTTTVPGGSTTSTTGGAPTTTTTFPPGFGQRLAGTRLLLKANPKSAAKKSLVLLARDAAIVAGDPTTSGGSLRLFTTTGDRFDATYPLAAGKWKPIGKAGAIRGRRYVDPAGAIRSIVVKDGKLIKVKGRGAQLGYSLAANPDPVQVILAVGPARYCLAFPGGAFTAGKKYAAGSAPPGTCP